MALSVIVFSWDSVNTSTVLCHEVDDPDLRDARPARKAGASLADRIASVESATSMRSGHVLRRVDCCSDTGRAWRFAIDEVGLNFRTALRASLGSESGPAPKPDRGRG